MLLQIVANTWDVGGDFDTGGQANTGYLAQRRVWLLRGGRVNASTDPTPLRAALEGRGLALGDLVLSALADQLLDRWHCLPSSFDFASVKTELVVQFPLGSSTHAVGCVVLPAGNHGAKSHVDPRRIRAPCASSGEVAHNEMHLMVQAQVQRLPVSGPRRQSGVPQDET